MAPSKNVTSSTETNKPAGIKDAISANNEAGATPVENEATPAKNEVAQAETEGTPAQNETTSPTDGTPTTLDNASSDTGAAAAGPSANKNTRKTIWPRAWRNAGETVPEFGRYPVNFQQHISPIPRSTSRSGRRNFWNRINRVLGRRDTEPLGTENERQRARELRSVTTPASIGKTPSSVGNISSPVGNVTQSVGTTTSSVGNIPFSVGNISSSVGSISSSASNTISSATNTALSVSKPQDKGKGKRIRRGGRALLKSAILDTIQEQAEDEETAAGRATAARTGPDADGASASTSRRPYSPERSTPAERAPWMANRVEFPSGPVDTGTAEDRWNIGGGAYPRGPSAAERDAWMPTCAHPTRAPPTVGGGTGVPDIFGTSWSPAGLASNWGMPSHRGPPPGLATTPRDGWVSERPYHPRGHEENMQRRVNSPTGAPPGPAIKPYGWMWSDQPHSPRDPNVQTSHRNDTPYGHGDSQYSQYGAYRPYGDGPNDSWGQDITSYGPPRRYHDQTIYGDSFNELVPTEGQGYGRQLGYGNMYPARGQGGAPPNRRGGYSPGYDAGPAHRCQRGLPPSMSGLATGATFNVMPASNEPTSQASVFNYGTTNPQAVLHAPEGDGVVRNELPASTGMMRRSTTQNDAGDAPHIGSAFGTNIAPGTTRVSRTGTANGTGVATTHGTNLARSAGHAPGVEPVSETSGTAHDTGITHPEISSAPGTVIALGRTTNNLPGNGIVNVAGDVSGTRTTPETGNIPEVIISSSIGGESGAGTALAVGVTHNTGSAHETHGIYNSSETGTAQDARTANGIGNGQGCSTPPEARQASDQLSTEAKRDPDAIESKEKACDEEAVEERVALPC